LLFSLQKIEKYNKIVFLFIYEYNFYH